MGIDNFFNTISKTNLCPKKLLKSIKLECNYLYIDFNSIIYSMIDKVEYDINYYLYSILINDKDDYYTNKVEYEYNIDFNTLDEFLNYFNQENIDKTIKIKIYDFLKGICKSIDKPELVENIFISFDGTPTLSKISEQKRRKYVNCVISDIKKYIYEKNIDSIDDIRNIYYNNKISFSKNNQDYSGIWSGHFQNIYNNIDSFEFKRELKDIFINIKNINISSAYEFGEGEKKIVEHILENKRSGKYVIFSPDSDVVLLSLIIKNKLLKNNIESEFNILKYDLNTEEIECYDINILGKNIIDNVYNKLNPFRKFNHDKIHILNDIIALITFLVMILFQK